MKFYTFDETTYPGIPDDVGPEIKLTNRFCDPALAAQTYQEHLDEWVLCEELGFDGALVNEHHFTYFNINPSSTVFAAALITRTKRMEVGVIGHVLPLRHPIQTGGICPARHALRGPFYWRYRAWGAVGVRLV
jgi:hypothetical protein